ncbi:MAG: type VI secretion protein IcmF/TssM N-terminal domain-containing protein [Geobacteraceae bacterium]
MNEAFQKICKVSLFIVAGTLLVLVVVGIVLIFDWPWWVALFLFLLVAGLFIGMIFLQKLWLKKREQNFVREISEEEASRLKALSAGENSEARELRDRWKKAIETLRGSHLKKQGNPLYVLPWYMVIGESGSGKTTSLSSARLATPFADLGRVRGVSGTKQCDWWFFEQAVVIDTAGRYAIPINVDRDREEWQKFLSLLLRYRRKEPLNGLIVTVAADRLLKSHSDELEKEGLAIRRRIDELMRALSIKFPVYLLVTKCDLINGVNRFCENLPEKSLNQPMGIINQDLSSDVDAFLARALTTIDERLRNLRLHLLHEPQSRSADPELLLFPEEFERLKLGLGVFMTNVFRQNPYQETPVLRGLFFSSGRQEGTPHSLFSETVGDARKGKSLPGTNKGLFLHDFFATILPRDRSLLAPTRRAIEWQILTGNLGLTSWLIVGVALCGLLSFSFVKNMSTIREISQEFSRPTALGGDTFANLVTMERFRREIMRVENRNRHWWIPRFGLNESIKVERELKQRYCRQFQEFLLAPFDKQMAATMTTMSAGTPDDLYGQYVMHVVRRINILKARQVDPQMEVLLVKPQPSYVSLLPAQDPGVTVEAKKAFGSLYLSYLIWRIDSSDTSRELTELQSWLKQLITVKGGNLQWLASWVDAQSGLPAITLKEFWGGSLTASEERLVPPSYSRKGKAAIDSLLGELLVAMPNQGTFTGQKAEFDFWYKKSAIESWQGFVANFSKGIERLQGAKEWRHLAARMSGDQGPYFGLLNRIALELEPLVASDAMPAWLQQVYHYQAARAQGLVQKTGTAADAAGAGNKLINTIKRNIGSEANAKELNTQLEVGRACLEYRKSLEAITPATASRNLAFQLAAQTFAEDRVTGKSHFYTASTAIAKLKNNMPAGAPDEIFWQLLDGPFYFLWTYVRRESACQLQAIWEEQVLAPTLGMTSQQAMPVLVGPDGLAWRFMKGPAAPFLKGSMFGYRAKEALGGSVPLQNSLFAFFGKGAQAQATVMALGRPQQFSIGIKGLPTDANVEASTKPHAARLELQCGGNSQNLINNNYPVSKTFYWSPDSCGDVVLHIEVGDVVLTRHYMGQEGFPNFLKDMHGGQRTFLAREFPGEKGALAKMGVKFITVNYRFSGSGAVLKQTATLSGQAPRSIAQCWTH